MEQTRKQFNELFFGTNGTGKTTEMLKLAIQYFEQPQNENKNFLIAVPDLSESKYDCFPEITVNDLGGDFGVGLIQAQYIDKSNKKQKSIYTEIYERYAAKGRKFNGLMINDDMGIMFGRRPQDNINMCTRKRQMNLDLMWNFHGLTTDCPPAFFKSVSGITLFKTEDNYLDTMKKIAMNKRKQFEDAYFWVQAVTNGVMLDANGNETEDEAEAIYNKEKKFDQYFKIRVS